MVRRFEDSILAEIEEVGEIPINLIVPFFKEYKLGNKILNPIQDHPENYKISKEEFHLLQKELFDLMKSSGIRLYLYIGKGKNCQTWEDCFNKVDRTETDEILSSYELLIDPRPDKPLFLSFE